MPRRRIRALLQEVLMADFSPSYYKTIKVIDSFTERTGNAFAWLCVPLAIVVFYEVVSRYFFDDPTIWAYDLSYMLYGALFMLGAAFALRRGAHIRTDMLWEKFSDRTKGKIDFYAYILFFFPGMILLFATSIDDAWHAFAFGELSEQTPWRPYLWPLKSVVPLTALLLLIQGVSEILKSWYMMRTGKAFEHKIGGEI
jgi:TRAP-type mannitol/chloroaromatic compound transport system permease small subunit